MSSRFIGYKDSFWKVIKEFKYTGAPQPFTLDPGEYLFVCKGAKGGNRTEYRETRPEVNQLLRGAVAMGVINLENTKTMYAMVGGDGKKAKYREFSPNEGGWNGGGKGGACVYTPEWEGDGGYVDQFNGPSGGGASDIRLSIEEEYIDYIGPYTLPEGYYDLDRIEASGSQVVKTDYIFKANTEMIVDCYITENTARNYEAIFGARKSSSANQFILFTRFASSNKFCYGYNTTENPGDAFNNYNQRIIIKTDGDDVFVYNTDYEQLYSLTTTRGSKNAGTVPMFFFNFNNNGSVPGYYCNGSIFNVVIYEGAEVVKYMVPYAKKNENDVVTEIGLYDFISNTAYPGTGTLSYGTLYEDKIEHRIMAHKYEETLNSRIIVAGGGGGDAENGEGSNDYTNPSTRLGRMGGGIVAGWNTDLGNAYNGGLYASQTSGYAFGKGMDAQNQTYSGPIPERTPEDPYPTRPVFGSLSGQGGGGGGWYGGYATKDKNDAYQSDGLAYGGSGGSSYVLTTTSTRPSYAYLYRFRNDIDELCMTDPLMLTGHAETAEVLVCQKGHVPLQGDVIEIPYTASVEHFTLLPGKYNFKCWGGAGGTRYAYEKRNVSKYGKGGYAEGSLNLMHPEDIFCRVGSSGFTVGTAGNAAYTEQFCSPAVNFNGVATSSYADEKQGARFGGGATDVRLKTDSTYARFIVAGGAGGTGAPDSYGGDGGGEAGGFYVTGSGSNYGTNKGPGSQTGTGYDSSNPDRNGGFGYGGNSNYYSNKSYGGQGGSGWYGGSGTTASNNNGGSKGGSGGSGYVLTKESYKPSGYLLDDPKYYLFETRLISGGNNLMNITKMEIDVLNASALYTLVNDQEGWKTFNHDTQQWESVVINDLTPETFIENGTMGFENETGLIPPYDVYVYDFFGVHPTNLSYYVIPLRQRISIYEYTNAEVLKMVPDFDADEGTTIDTNYYVDGHGAYRRVIINVFVDIDRIPEVNMNALYSIQLNIRRPSSGYYYPTPPVKTIDDLDLLVVGGSRDIPKRYKYHMGGFLPDGTTAISQINTSATGEYKRIIYTATVCNEQILRIAAFNIVENTSTVIRDIELSSISNTKYFAGRVLCDGENVWVSSSQTGNRMQIIQVPLDPEKEVTVYWDANSSNNYISSYGEMAWLDEETIILPERGGFSLFDTIRHNFALIRYYGNATQTNVSAIAKGEKYTIVFPLGSSSKPYVFDNAQRTSVSNSIYDDDGMSGNKTVCYGDGKFYVTMQGNIFVHDEDLKLVDHYLAPPYTSKIPKTINYTSGYIYVTLSDSLTVCAYDIKGDRWGSTSIPFKEGAYNTALDYYTPTTFKGFLFINNLRLLAMNFKAYAKYNVGTKSELLLIKTNSEYIFDRIECDERFVTMNESNISFHPGYIKYPLTMIDSMNGIYKTSQQVNSPEEFKEFISYEIDAGEEEPNNG